MKGLLGGQNPVANRLNRAGREMGNAQNQLGGNDADSAVEIRRRTCCRRCAKGRDALTKKLQDRQKQRQTGRRRMNEDPLGREQGSARAELRQGRHEVPSQSEMERARNILQELRRRAAERGRPQEELDYIDRLLKQF